FARAASAMTYAGGPVPKLDTVVRDVPHGSAFIDSETQLAAFRTRFRNVKPVSLTPVQSRDFINRLAKELCDSHGQVAEGPVRGPRRRQQLRTEREPTHPHIRPRLHSPRPGHPHLPRLCLRGVRRGAEEADERIMTHTAPAPAGWPPPGASCPSTGARKESRHVR